MNFTASSQYKQDQPRQQ